MSFRNFFLRLCNHVRRYSTTQFTNTSSRKSVTQVAICAACGGLLATYLKYQHETKINWKMKQLTAKGVNAEVDAEDDNLDYTSEACDDGHEGRVDVYQHSRGVRFKKFASVKYKNEFYMTPQDFLESVTEEDPRPRLSVRELNKNELDTMLRKTPGHTKASSHLLRQIHENGIISYTEYLFLLCILTKPHIGFKIAFNMFDTDGNDRVEKNEFLVLEEIFRKKSERRKAKSQENKSDDYTPTSFGAVQRALSSKKLDVQDTSLLVHFFGLKGDGYINYEQFHVFMHNLQTEVFELEFLTYSHGMPTISEEDFARVLLRYTDVLDEEEYIEKLRVKMPEEKGITFEEFQSFFQFLNNLEDFAISMQMYAFAGQAFGEEEFRRAVKVSTGHDLSKNLISTLFHLFDKDGDGKLSYVEFIGVMKDRIHRGFRSHLMKHAGWNGFKRCIKQDLKERNKETADCRH